MRPRTGAEVKAVLDAERAGSAFLVFRDGADDLLIVALGDGRPMLTLGRSDACDVSLRWDARVSSTHAVLELLARTWTLSDDGISRNGTFVNDTRIGARRRLGDRDVIRVGATLIMFRAATQSDVTATALDSRVPHTPITPTQRRVLIALCRPLKDGAFTSPASNAQIAAELVLSVDAVKTHLRGISDRLGVGELPQNQKRASIVARAFELGLVSDRDL